MLILTQFSSNFIVILFECCYTTAIYEYFGKVYAYMSSLYIFPTKFLKFDFCTVLEFQFFVVLACSELCIGVQSSAFAAPIAV